MEFITRYFRTGYGAECLEHEDFPEHTEEALHRVAKNIILYSPYLYTCGVFYEFVGKFLSHIGRKENARVLLSAFVNDILVENGTPPDRVTALLDLFHGCVIRINDLCDDHHFNMQYFREENSESAKIELEIEQADHLKKLKTFTTLIVLVLETDLNSEFFKDSLHVNKFSRSAHNCEFFRQALCPVWEFLMASKDVNMIKGLWRDIGTCWLQIYQPSMEVYERGDYDENQMFFKMLDALLSVVPEVKQGSFAARLLARFPRHILNDFHYDKDVIIRICRELVLNEYTKLHVFQKHRAVNLLACSVRGIDMLCNEPRFQTIENESLKEAINLRGKLTHKILPGTTDSAIQRMLTPQLTSIQGMDASQANLSFGLKNILIKIPHLKYLVLRDTDLTDNTLKHCCNYWTGLAVLDLTSCALITDNSIPLLIQFTNLKLLNIVRTGISHGGFVKLKLNFNPLGTRILYAEDPHKPTFEL